MRADTSPAMAFDSSAFASGGVMGELMQTFEWRSSPLGAPQSWPETLKCAVRIVLTSPSAMWLAWGKDQRVLYNDACRPLLGANADRALGMRAREAWSGLRTDVVARARAVYEERVATREEAIPLLMRRDGNL